MEKKKRRPSLALIVLAVILLIAIAAAAYVLSVRSGQVLVDEEWVPVTVE